MAKASMSMQSMDHPKAVEALVGITEQAIAFRFAERARHHWAMSCAL
jgi:hypothetical protein